jgi:adenylylsulfate kinase-like enzyme
MHLDRPGQVKTVLERLDLHVSTRDFHRDPYIYALWIEGRSGNGKSVLLLQLVQRLVQDRAAQVIWLDDASEHLLP